jgi:hypothetical protein
VRLTAGQLVVVSALDGCTVGWIDWGRVEPQQRIRWIDFTSLVAISCGITGYGRGAAESTPRTTPENPMGNDEGSLSAQLRPNYPSIGLAAHCRIHLRPPSARPEMASHARAISSAAQQRHHPGTLAPSHGPPRSSTFFF